MSFTEARAVCSQLVWREYDDKLYKDAKQKLVRELISTSPRVSTLQNWLAGTSTSPGAAQQAGLFLLDAQGFDRLGGETKLCRDVLRLASRHGYGPDCRIGIADGAFASRVASSTRQRHWYIVPPGEDARFLAPLEIEYMPIGAEARENLKELGIKTIAQFIALPYSSYLGRFDSDVLRIYEVIKGTSNDTTSPSLPVYAKQYQCVIDIGSANDSLHDALFILKNMLERLCVQLKNDGLIAEELTVAFFNDEERFDERPLKLIKTSNNSKFLLDVLRLSLESNPLKREYTAVHLGISRFSRELFDQTKIKEGEASANQNNFASLASLDQLLVERHTQSDAVLLLMQKFMTRLGERSLVKPIYNDQYIIDQAGLWLPVTTGIKKHYNHYNYTEANQYNPIDYDFVNQYHPLSCHGNSRKDSLMPGLVIKRQTPPAPVFVQFIESKNSTENKNSTESKNTKNIEELRSNHPIPEAVAFKGVWYNINRITLPENISGMWWETPVRKSYYTAVLERKRELRVAGRGYGNGSLHKSAARLQLITVLLVFDHQERGWYIEGVFD